MAEKLTDGAVLKYLKLQCNYFLNGQCYTTRCFILAGWDGEGAPGDLEPTCEYRRAAELLEPVEMPF